MKPYSIRIFLPDGVRDGLRLVEKSNWSGLGIVCPRSLLGESKSRAEFLRTGVYVLVGESETSGLPTVYVGESDSIRPRLEQHASKKDFWTAVTFFVSKDDNLNRAHVQYLESRLVGLASEAKRCVLDNGNVPAPPSLSEADRADADQDTTQGRTDHPRRRQRQLHQGDPVTELCRRQDVRDVGAPGRTGEGERHALRERDQD